MFSQNSLRHQAETESRGICAFNPKPLWSKTQTKAETNHQPQDESSYIGSKKQLFGWL